MLLLTQVVSIDTGVDADLGTARLHFDRTGLLRQMMIVIPDLTGSGALTTTVRLKDDNGLTVYEKSGLVENATRTETGLTTPIVPTPRAADGFFGLDLEVELSGDEGSNQDFTVYFWLDEK